MRPGYAAKLKITPITAEARMNQIGCSFVFRFKMNTAKAKASAGRLIRSVIAPVSRNSPFSAVAVSRLI